MLYFSSGVFKKVDGYIFDRKSISAGRIHVSLIDFYLRNNKIVYRIQLYADNDLIRYINGITAPDTAKTTKKYYSKFTKGVWLEIGDWIINIYEDSTATAHRIHDMKHYYIADKIEKVRVKTENGYKTLYIWRFKRGDKGIKAFFLETGTGLKSKILSLFEQKAKKTLPAIISEYNKATPSKEYTVTIQLNKYSYSKHRNYIIGAVGELLYKNKALKVTDSIVKKVIEGGADVIKDDIAVEIKTLSSDYASDTHPEIGQLPSQLLNYVFAEGEFHSKIKIVIYKIKVISENISQDGKTGTIKVKLTKAVEKTFKWTGDCWSTEP